MLKSLSKKLDELELKVTNSIEGREFSTVVGIVCPKQGHLYNLAWDGEAWVQTVANAHMYIAAKLEVVLRSNKRFIIVIGGRGCVHADTLLDTPSGKIAIKDFKGGEIYSHKDGKVVISTASKPARFEAVDLFDVKLSNGNSIICTDEHKFLTPSGWFMLKDLSVGDGIFSSLPAELECLHRSTLDTSLLELLSSVQNLTRKLVDCLDDYFVYHHQCDLPPRLAVSTDQVFLPLQDGEQQHNIHALYHLDDQVFSCRRNPSSSLPRHSSRLAHQGEEGKSYAYQENDNAYRSFEQLSGFYLQFPQSQTCINQMRQALLLLKQSQAHDSVKHLVESLETDLCKLERAYVGNSLVVNSGFEISPTLTQIESIRNHSRQEYWDLHVAETNCYFANGILNHNSGKSVQILDIAMTGVKDLGDKVYCLREFQNSLEDSVHSLITSEYERLNFDGFSTQNNVIFHESGGEFKFKGLARNPASIKSAAGFRRFLVEEAQTTSEESLKQLTPTARNKAVAGLPKKFLVEDSEQQDEESALSKVQLIFIANPASSADPFSQRFIVPFQEHLERDGIYEDDLHLVVVMNYSDNPWFDDSGLEAERRYDEENLPYAAYKHIWLGGFNDHVDNALIPAEWFNAAIDAHKKLNFQARGSVIASHDPSDQGDDPKGLAIRHGSVFTSIKEILHCDAYQGVKVAHDESHFANADYFLWDGDGLGATLRNDITNQFAGKRTILQMFKGSESADNPEAVYSFDNKGVPVRNAARNKDVFKNKRSQYYWMMRDRFYNTYRAIVRGEYVDPDEMISIDSAGVDNIDKLRSEVCRIPIKPNNNGYIQIMSKLEMKAIKIPSPNMADAMMMSFANKTQLAQNIHRPRVMPQPIRVKGRV